MKRALLLIALLASPASAGPSHCYDGPGMRARVCYMCQKGPWYDIKDYECSAAEEARQERAFARNAARYRYREPKQ